ncbi:Leucine rich repeat N-terminal domain [Seminavis robusta]|uniref:Leucine rich repeat N-terminal domain n=1 Tax=Seminavis robusta TaxID=568900 RepID=A0A9N8DCB4_9STRA|nr:Leucine rich repeat N-terminal domain [Seminavis robusta]|eukprot:Sro32_g020610.1 Leucine rich repeat N-terminal domain (804) ;mRNA; f:13526-16470
MSASRKRPGDTDDDEVDVLKVVVEARAKGGHPNSTYDGETRPNREEHTSCSRYPNGPAHTRHTANMALPALARAAPQKKAPNETEEHEGDATILKVVGVRARAANQELQREDGALLDQSNSRSRSTTVSEIRPGAYAGAPGEALQRNPSVRYSRLEQGNDLQMAQVPQPPAASMDPEIGSLMTSQQPQQDNTDRDLTEADPVTNDELPQAVEWDESKRSKRGLAMDPTKLVLLAFCALFVLTGIVVAYIMLSPSKEKHNIVVTNSPTPTDSPPTPSPTLFTRDVRLNLLLPKDAVDSIQQPPSPQSQAYNWTLRDPSFNSYPDDRLLQRFILATWFYATDGPSWFNNSHWLSYTEHECHWFQNSFPIHVLSYLPYEYPDPMTTPCRNMSNLDTGWQYEHLSLAQNGLDGIIPNELFLLTSLKSIDFGLNLNLRGKLLVGDQISKLSKLQFLGISNTAMHGSIPTEIGTLTNLVDLSLAFEQLTGVIPTEIGKLTLLKYLSSHRTQLQGPLPSEMGLLSNMLAINLGSNQMTSTIPTHLFSLQKLMALFFYEAQMSGTIPTEIGLLTDMVHLYIGRNKFEGTLPSELGLLASLEVLTINNVNITSTIPTTLGQLSRLFGLSCLGTGLTGTIPSEIGLVPFVGSDSPYSVSSEFRIYQLGPYFSLVKNSLLTGPIPSEVANMRGLEWLQLVDNHLTGSISPALSQLDMKKLELYGNSFSGPLPSEIGLWGKLSQFNASNNGITGSIPGEVGLLAAAGGNQSTVLEYFDVAGNDLEGTVPFGLCTLNDTLLFDCGSGLCGCDCSCA